MSFNTLHVIAATSVVTALVLLQVCDGYRTRVVCLTPCLPDIECPTLPDDCEPTKKACACCMTCKGKVGAVCGSMQLDCASGLMCVTRRGVAVPVYTSDYFDFWGTCQKVDMCRVITRSWADVRRDDNEGNERKYRLTPNFVKVEID